MNKERLLRLADLLEADAKNPTGVKFDLHKWVLGHPEVPQIDCGTVACAVGLAMLDPQFRSEGLGMRPAYEGSCHYIPLYDGFLEWDAVEKFFDLSEKESTILFASDYYEHGKATGSRGEKAVASRIRKFVEDKDSVIEEIG